MSHSITLEGIVLHTYDVGEADRFCIILTKERGRLAARAKAVRKLSSRMGGSLLALHHISVSLHEGSNGYLVTGVHSASQTPSTTFLHYQEPIDLLLSLLHDEEPVPEVYDAMRTLLEQPEPQENILPFALHCLSHLGLLPVSHDAIPLLRMTEVQKLFLQECATERWVNVEPLNDREAMPVYRLCEEIVSQNASRPLHIHRYAAR